MENVKNIENIRDSDTITIPRTDYLRLVEENQKLHQLVSEPLILKGDNTQVNLDGLHITIGDLKEHVIDSHQYREYIRELRDKAEMEVGQ